MKNNWQTNPTTKQYLIFLFFIITSIVNSLGFLTDSFTETLFSSDLIGFKLLLFVPIIWAFMMTKNYIKTFKNV